AGRGVTAAAVSLRPGCVECRWVPYYDFAVGGRKEHGMAGMTPEVAIGFRDKPIMKQRLFGADLRVPRFARVRTAREAFEAADAIGYPVCVKPVAGAGSADTYRVGDDNELRAVLAAVERHPEINLEEFIEGEEFTYDT